MKVTQTVTKSFAPDYYRRTIDGEEGLIEFPDDIMLRKDIMIQKVDHPAHNNLFMLRELVEYLTVPGDWICDPMAGAGSMMYTIRDQINLVLFELGPYFSEMLVKNKAGFIGSDRINIHEETDCVVGLQQYPGKFKAIIFSPPYASQLQNLSGHAIYEKEGTSAGAGIINYTYDDRRNLANMKEFKFNKSMREVYKACFDATQQGGYCVVIIKDRMDKGRRVGYGTQHARMLFQAGYVPYQWYQRVAIGKVFGTFNMKRGIKQVQDEHIIIVRKP